MEQLQCNWSSLRSASRTLTAAYDEALRPSGLRVTQFSILARLGSVGPLRMNELAERLAMDRTTLGRNLRPLQRDGLVSLEVGEDRRERLIGLTAQGRKAVKDALPLWRGVHERFEAEFGKGKARDLRAALGSVVSAGRSLIGDSASLAEAEG